MKEIPKPITKNHLRYVDLPHVRDRIRRMKRFKDIDTDVAIDAFIEFYRDKENELHEEDYVKRLIYWLKTEWEWKLVHKEYRKHSSPFE